MELLINVTNDETRAAYISHGKLQEIYIEKDEKQGIVGNIYKGKVVRILKGMQAAFVDIGIERSAFLHLKDAKRIVNLTTRYLTDELQVGQEILVQATKDSLGAKGPRLTTSISIPSRYLILLPAGNNLLISRKIDDVKIRESIKKAILHRLDVGCIVRTAAASVDFDTIISDLSYLYSIWHKIIDKYERTFKPGIIYEERSLAIRLLRDLKDLCIRKIIVDNEKVYEEVKEFVEEFMPSIAKKVFQAANDGTLFAKRGIEQEIENIFSTHVPLNSGGYLVIEHTEAMTTIDVNTGTYTGYKDAEQTALTTNLYAAEAIVYQLKLRNIGGLIAIDFIDMQDTDNQQKVVDLMRNLLKDDRVPSRVEDFTKFGIVLMTRKRTRPSLLELLGQHCTHCQGKGWAKSAETICNSIFRIALSKHINNPNKKIIVHVSTIVYATFRANRNLWEQLRRRTNAMVNLKPNNSCGKEEYHLELY